MRPPEFTGGNVNVPGPVAVLLKCFNEAAGIHRRKRLDAGGASGQTVSASMRPPEFTGGNATAHSEAATVPEVASMRPPEFTGGNSGRAVP